MTGRRLFILLYYIFRVLLSTLRFFHKFSPFSLAKPRGEPHGKEENVMHDDLTAQDIAMMQKELDHRKLELMPELIEEVKRTRAFGDLSENFEYKAAKQAQNRNRSRIRYLERMIKSAHVIEDKAGADEVGLFDKVELLFEDDEDTETVQVKG